MTTQKQPISSINMPRTVRKGSYVYESHPEPLEALSLHLSLVNNLHPEPPRPKNLLR